MAVLPFRDLTGDPARAYFAAGVTDEIRGQLSKLGALRVLSRGAVQRYGDANVKGLRADLGAGSAVEGSVRLEGARVRVAVELVDTETEQTLWSEQYDRRLEDVLSVQRDVALRIAEALKATLSPAERKSVERLPTTNPEAYQIYLRSLVLSSLERQQNLRAIELLQDALKLDPGFAVAQASDGVPDCFFSRTTEIPSISTSPSNRRSGRSTWTRRWRELMWLSPAAMR